jgi:GNAT superfamily N-acetyltransferase
MQGSAEQSVVVIVPLAPDDRQGWDSLARGYKAFYETVHTEAEYDHAWHRLVTGDGIHGLGAHLDGKLVGITHFLYHPSVWSSEACYLQDLFVDQRVRGKGLARALIDAVASASRKRGAARLYWTTRHDNATARALYDKVAQHRGFIRYDYQLVGESAPAPSAPR